MTNLQLSRWRVCPIQQILKFHLQPMESKSVYKEHLAFFVHKQPASPFLKKKKKPTKKPQNKKARKQHIILEQDSSDIGKLEWFKSKLKQQGGIVSDIKTACVQQLSPRYNIIFLQHCKPVLLL